MSHPQDPGKSQTVGALFSGGIDSAMLLVHLLEQGCYVQPIYLRTGLPAEREELLAAVRYLRAIRCKSLGKLVSLALPLDDLLDSPEISEPPLSGSVLFADAGELAGSELLMITKGAVWCRLHGLDALALARPLGDLPAESQHRFLADLPGMLSDVGVSGLALQAPILSWTRRQVIARSRQYPLDLTFSCRMPVEGMHCGQCAKCQHRQASFRECELTDPTRYFSSRRTASA